MSRNVPRATGATPPPTLLPGSKVEVRPPTTSITDCILRLDEVVGRLLDQLDLLEVRLMPALRNAGKDPCCDIEALIRDESPGCCLAEQVNTQRARVDAACARVEQLLDRVEV